MFQKAKHVLTSAIFSILLSSIIVQATTPGTTLYLTGGPYSFGSAFTVWNEGGTYFGKNGFGWVAASGTNFSSVFETCLDNMPTYGGVIHLMAGYYDGWIVIDRDGVILEGDGCYNSIPTGIPDNAPIALYGSVLKVTTADKDGIKITGQRYNVQIANLGIWFSAASTGCGITTDVSNTYTLTGAVIQNIRVLDCDSNSYAIRLVNFLHCKIEGILSWGGPMLELYALKAEFQQGNSIFDMMFGYIKYDLAPIVYESGPYPIFIHANKSAYPYNSWTNLLNMRRIQISNPVGQVDADYYSFVCWDLKYSTLSNLDFEGANLGNHTILMGSCDSVFFDTLYMWEQSPNHAYLAVASNNQHLTFENCYIEGLLDSNSTDKYAGCNIVGPIDSNTMADLQGLENNTGYATTTDGTVTITARFIGPMDYVVIQEISTAVVTGLKVDTITRAPTNTFVVNRLDETATGSITFYWRVVHKDGWRN